MKPVLDAMEGDDFDEKSTRYKFAMSEYKSELYDYYSEQKVMVNIIRHIYDTTAASNLSCIEKVEVHPWNLLRALKARLAPSDAARCRDLEQRYTRIIQGPSKRQNAEAWLDDYQRIHVSCKNYKIAEVGNGERAYRDFLEAVSTTAPSFSNIRYIGLSNIHYMGLEKIIDYDAKLLETIKEYGDYIHLMDARQTALTSSSAFAAADSIDESTSNNESNNKGSSSRTSSFRGGNHNVPTCICGSKHWYSECNYLNEEERPANWKPDEEIQTKVNQAIKNNKKKQAVERNIARTKGIKERK
ncbi:MAG: hypothetical protein Q9191_008198 [Dirinaria sp. TL-2023a]